MHRREFLKTAFCYSVIGSLSAPLSAKETPSKRPNLLVVMCDQLREMSLSCSGDPNIRTPHIDRLASKGIRFTRMYTPSPLCSPARASFHTGFYPHKVGFNYANDTHLSPSHATLAECLKAEGYVTGHIGKWHLNGTALSEDRYVPPQYHRGFDYWLGFEHGHTYFNSPHYGKTPEPVYPQEGVFETDFQTQKAVDFIRQNKDRTWYLDLSWGPPHFPLTPENVKKADLDMFISKTFTLRDNVPTPLSAEQLQEIAIYYAMIKNLDDNLGRLLAVLDELELNRDTIVVFTSDHGDMLYSHGNIYKRRPQEESSRVPFILRYPRQVKAATVTSELASLLDFVPTIIELAGCRSIECDGRSLSDLIRGKSTKGPNEAVFMGCAWLGCRPAGGNHYLRHWRAIRTGNYMACCLDDGSGKTELIGLYDLEKDPYQKTNLCENEACREIAQNLHKEINAHIQRTDDSHFRG